MEIGLFIKEVMPKTWKMTISRRPILGGAFIGGVFIGGFTVCGTTEFWLVFFYYRFNNPADITDFLCSILLLGS